jgi:D-3-phosphoglycerate dehydrogenase
LAKSRLLIADPIHQDAIELLKSAGFEIVNQPEISQAEVIKIIKDFDAIVVRSRTKVSREVIEAGKRLKVVARSGVGLDNVDLEAAKERGLKVVNSPEGPSISVAELVFALVLSIVRKVAFADHGMREGKWLKKECTGSELRGRVLGIVGFGLIGEEVAKRAIAFDMTVLGFDILPDRINVMKKMGVKSCSIKELITASNILTVHVPLNPKTKGLIGATEIKMLPKGAIVINTARGGIVDEEALYDGLANGHLGGAGMDVFSEEPPHQNSLLRKLITLPNVVCTPHIGAETSDASRKNSMIIAEKLQELLD